jgi:hypothetical protein
LFPPHERDSLEFSFILSSCLDVVDTRSASKSADQDFGLLQAIDDRLACYGWITNTGVKFIIIVDTAVTILHELSPPSIVGIKDTRLKPVSSP